MKKKKITIKYFIIISLLIIGALPMINFYQYAIKYDFKKLFNTDKIETYVNYGFYKLFSKSLEKNKVIVGKDDFLFSGNKYNNVLHKTQGLYKYNDNDINNWIKKLKNVQTWYEDRGIKFVFVIVPNKHSVYKDKLPNWIKTNNQTITDKIIKYSNEESINMLDLRKIFIENRKNDKDFLYLKTDTHWNGLGASIAYNETMKFINKRYITSYNSIDYKLFNHNYNNKGKDLSRLLKISNMFPDNHEQSIWVKFDKNYDICIGNIDKQTHKLNKCNIEKNPLFSINQQPKYTINKKSINNIDALILCDSFGFYHAQLYNTTFNNIWKFHYEHINGNKLSNFVNKHKPDIIIYQVVERALGKENLVKKLSDISMVDYANKNIDNKIFNINNKKYYKNNKLTITNKELIVTHNDPVIILNKLTTKSKFVRLNYDLYSPLNTTFQLFYKEHKKDNYRGSNFYNVAIKKGSNKISLSIPAKYINNQLRVDLVSTIGKYKINDFSIYEIK